jgi:DNA-binding transcriptional MerR regulator
MVAVAYHREMAPPPSQELTIDELAQLTGTTVRNIRAHQSRGLLPAPRIRARTGYYGPDHVSRLRMIQAMQAEGFRLDAIQRLLERPEGAGEQIFNFGRTLLSSFADTAPEFATSEELERRFGAPLEERLLRKAQRLGLLHSLGEGRWEIRNPTLMAAGEELAAMGIPLSHALAVAEQIERHTRAIADAYVRLFLSDVVGSRRLGDQPPEEWTRLSEALERLRPLASGAVRAGFEQAMSDAVEREVEKFLGKR